MFKHIKNKIIACFVIGTIIFIIGSGLSGGLHFNSINDFLISFGFYQLYSYVLGFINMFYFDYLERKKWNDNERTKRVLIGIVGSVALTLLGLFFLRMLTAVYFEGISFESFISSETWSSYTFGLWITLTVVITFHAFYFFKKTQEKKVKDSQIVAKTETAKFETLKNQLDPHFLFNSLNVLTSLIGENPQQAEKFTTKLSKVYRYVLEQKGKDLISLEDELKFAKSYMELLKMRFEDGIHFSIPDTISNPELKIVPLSLQLLLENAVKHNVITSERPLEIKIYENNGFLIIENNINPKTSLEKSTKVGLQNINQRYSLITNRKVEIKNDNRIFKVKLPLLTQEIKIMKTDYINDSNKYIRAKKRIDDLKEFYGSLISYCIVIPFLVYINYRTYWGFQWFWFPMFGWGLGLVIQAFKVFGYGMGWEERKIREYMEKDSKF
ncbi:2TM domain-containing protein [Urechidicola croceus]|uniref:Histidine kinase n=1 Tax=Urechidicola croceus TaxID=1850246 RepID=A0A1D8P5P6_9FLAO|nr:2TM domain-containing protein [Urechidicola croceus]AOW19895.1 histidine kinase [Urechidicola croceus]